MKKESCISFTATLVSVESIVVDTAVKLHRFVSVRVAMQHVAANSPNDRCTICRRRMRRGTTTKFSTELSDHRLDAFLQSVSTLPADNDGLSSRTN